MATKEESSVALRIVQACGVKDLKEASQMLGENYSSLHNWASGRRDFPTNVLIKIANLTNNSIDWILSGAEASPKQSGAANFETLLDEKIRRIVREEIADGTILHEKVQGIVLALQSNVKEAEILEEKPKKERAA